MFTRVSLLAATVTILNAPATRPLDTTDNLLRTVHSASVRADSVRLAAAIAEAERLASAGRLADSRRAYRKVISQELEQGEYPSEAMWRLANAYFGEGKELDAARALDELAEAAATFGDPRMELRARFEAAVLYSRHREPERVASHLRRVRMLLKSPAVDDTLRQSIKARLGNG